jgi:alpha-amylase
MPHSVSSFTRLTSIRTVLTRVGAAILLVLGATVTTVVFTAAVPRSAAHAASGPNGDVSVNLFEWNWDSVAAECTNHLGPAGVGSVQVAPPEESVFEPAADVASGTPHPWWEVYQPIAYDLNSRMGNESQFAAMVTACHNAGVAVIADAVLNHMAIATDTATTGYGSCTFDAATYSYPCVPYTSSDFHSNAPGGACPTADGQIDDWNDPTEVWNCQLGGLEDLATGETAVQDIEAAYLNSLIALGVDGFRLDAAKSIPPADIASIESMLNKTTWQGTAPYIVQEVPPGSTSTELQYGNYEGTGSVIDFDYAYDMDSAFSGGDLSTLNSLIGSNSAGALPPSQDSLDIITNQDTERAGSTLSYASGAPYVLANYFMLAYPFGTPQLYDGFTYSSYDQPPPDNASTGMINDVTNATCGTEWQCLHRQTGVVGMIGWHNAVSGTSVENWTATNNEVIAFSRGSRGWIAINDTAYPMAETYTTGLPNGYYCDVITGGVRSGGGCAGTEITVSGGHASVVVPADGAVAIDVNATTSAAPATVPVTFDEYATTTTGTNVYISGDVAALGNWATTASAIPEMSASGYPVWAVTVNLPANTTIQYKYLKLDSSGDVAWETNANRQITTGTSAMVVNNSWDIADSDATDVTFHVNATTSLGTNVYVSGSIPALGDWNTADAIPLDAGTYPIWYRLVMVPQNATFQYKYFEKNSSGTITWDSGSNLTFTTGTGPGYSTNDTW